MTRSWRFRPPHALIALVAILVVALGGAALAAGGSRKAGPQEAVAYANVLENGTIDPNASSDGIADANITHPSPGVYCVTGLSFAARSAVVSGDNSFGNDDTIASVAVDTIGEGLAGCPDGSPLRIRTLDPNGIAGSSAPPYAPARIDHRFQIWIRGDRNG
jgi:hypothetical protein